MFCLKFLLLMLLLCVKQEAELAITLRKFVYQKDLSEYCRRRVMPSVFLGRQVIGAYSQILHFSRLELPYSCFVSIRTESGSNIILVIQLLSDKSLVESCHHSKNQLLVYEIGETFGGYWGALPDYLIKPDSPKYENRYTLKTTQPTTTTTTEKSTTQQRTMPATTNEFDELEPTPDPRAFFTVELPIVNVSADLVPGSLPSNNLFDSEEIFDAKFDVKPWPGMSYQTRILPLVQFSVEDEFSGQRTGDQINVSPQDQVDFKADIFTPDSRLTLPLLTTKRKQRGKYKYNVNRRLAFKKSKKLFGDKEALFYRTWSESNYPTPIYSPGSNNLFTRPYDFLKLPSQKEVERTSDSWEVIDAILKNLSKTKIDVPNVKVDENVANLLHGLAKSGYSDSVYLLPNSSRTTRHPMSKTRSIRTKYKTDLITWRQPSASYRTNYLEEIEDLSKLESLSEDVNKSSDTVKSINNNDSVINDVGRTVPLLPPALDVDQVVLNVTNAKKMENIVTNNPPMLSEVKGTSTSASTPEIMKPLTLVDHESWENMVHAASLMAVMLNQSITTSADDGSQRPNVTAPMPRTNSSTMRREKRFIHAIPIEHAKPHHVPASVDTPSSTVQTDRISDAQEFQRLVELQDDEVHDRVALRYLKQYVGPALFNICDFNDATTKYVYLFNSSRLVLAITNFTLDRMTVVMTPARTLLTSEAHCTAAHLECQVSGARVCIDSLSACDGVPNCGSYDIYDEDRLRCGGSAGLQQKVCLAAIIFLAVLLTILYTVHYWLKRCVPKVSDAFFIYTDAAENVLYLDPIMRSPNDTGDHKYYYNDGAIQDYMECVNMHIKSHTVSSYIRRFFRLFRCRRKKSRVTHDEIIEDEFVNLHPNAPGFYPFGEVELGRVGSAFVADAAVQTGPSLEINEFREIGMNKEIDQFDSDSNVIFERRRSVMMMSSLADSEISSNQPSDELSILKFFRRARSVSMQYNETLPYVDKPAAKSTVKTEEKEIQVLNFDDSADDYDLAAASDSVIAEISDKKPDHRPVYKKLRFEEETNKIQAIEVDDYEEEVAPDRGRRSLAFTGVKNVRSDDMDSITEVNEPSTSANREFKSYFWGGGKNKPKKPKKKKTQLSLR